MLHLAQSACCLFDAKPGSALMQGILAFTEASHCAITLLLAESALQQSTGALSQSAQQHSGVPMRSLESAYQSACAHRARPIAAQKLASTSAFDVPHHCYVMTTYMLTGVSTLQAR